MSVNNLEQSKRFAEINLAAVAHLAGLTETSEAENETLVVTIYPNPATDEITIGGLDGNTTYNISITNAFGATVLPDREGCSNLLGEVSVSVGSFGSGVYFIRLENARECVTTKFVVK